VRKYSPKGHETSTESIPDTRRIEKKGIVREMSPERFSSVLDYGPTKTILGIVIKGFLMQYRLFDIS
jgi:hypothetical protein